MKLLEAIIDVVSDKLSDIFTDNGKLLPSVRRTIRNGVVKIKKEFPELGVHDYILVGAAVTYQYDDRSDIDTSVFVNPDVDEILFKKADKWIENNIDNKDYHGKRPYQFKLAKNSRKDLDNVESAYDVERDKWIKKPDIEKSKQLYNAKLGSPDTKIQQLYSKIENVIQPSLVRLKNKLAQLFEFQANKELKDYIVSAYNRYDKVIKPLRGNAFNAPLKTDLPSKNWEKGNIIYKLLDRDGYNQVFMLMKDIVRNNKFDDTEALNNLYDKLNKTVPQEIGFKRKDNY